MDCFYPKRFTVASHSPIHTPTAVPTMQGNNQHVRSRCLAQGHLDTWLGGARGSNQQPYGGQTTALTCWAAAAPCVLVSLCVVFVAVDHVSVPETALAVNVPGGLLDGALGDEGGVFCVTRHHGTLTLSPLGCTWWRTCIYWKADVCLWMLLILHLVSLLCILCGSLKWGYIYVCIYIYFKIFNA